VVAHDEVFGPDTDDEVWLAEAGRNRWIVPTRDDGIRYRPGAQQVVLQAGVICFCLHPTKGLTGDAMADVLANALPSILRLANHRPVGGYIIGLNRAGRLRQLFPRNR
jgi:hypothetical protein